MKKALVVDVKKPNVACAADIWAALVCIPVSKFGRIYRSKQWVFCNYIPRVGEWIVVELL